MLFRSIFAEIFITDEIIYALSIGLTQEQYWEMTQYEIELIQEAQNRKWEKEKRVEIFTINTLMRMFSKMLKL